MLQEEAEAYVDVFRLLIKRHLGYTPKANPVWSGEKFTETYYTWVCAFGKAAIWYPNDPDLGVHLLYDCNPKVDFSTVHEWPVSKFESMVRAMTLEAV